MDSKSYALLAQWLNGMSFAVNSYLIPIQLSVFLPRFDALPVTVTTKSADSL